MKAHMLRSCFLCLYALVPVDNLSLLKYSSSVLHVCLRLLWLLAHTSVCFYVCVSQRGPISRRENHSLDSAHCYVCIFIVCLWTLWTIPHYWLLLSVVSKWSKCPNPHYRYRAYRRLPFLPLTIVISLVSLLEMTQNEQNSWLYYSLAKRHSHTLRKDCEKHTWVWTERGRHRRPSAAHGCTKAYCEDLNGLGVQLKNWIFFFNYNQFLATHFPSAPQLMHVLD